MPPTKSNLDNDPLWFKDAVIYQLHVKTFFDSNNDGIGDFKGLTQKLDYLKSLGITAIWLLPFYPSPLRDDGYDIADYYNVNPQYGHLRDFKEFLRQAQKRGLRVITELVINHTSDQHPWFQRAKTAKPGSAHRDYYVWSDTPDKYKDVRIIFKDFEKSNWTWSEDARAYYWHRFYSHQPDLNFDNPTVQKEIFKVADFWFGLGVDGVRLDAVPYLYEREGTNCENLPETYAFLKKFRKHIDNKFKNKMLLAEANQWPEDAVGYFGKGDECHMAFHFPLMPRMYMALQMEDRYPIIDILEQTPDIPKNCQWATFLRNHDELTLEMVTDEERDYMYRAYAKDDRSKINLGIRRRLVPLMGNNRKKIELINVLLFSLLGTPIIYYGDEIGMGDNHFLGDRDGVRTPMQWSPDRNGGFSKASPHQLYLPVIMDSEYNFSAVNVETQENNLSSLLWWMKRVIAMRRNFKAFSQGKIKFLHADNPKVLCFLREYKDEKVLVVINLSRFSQVVEIDLHEFNGFIPEEVFSQNQFPGITERPYTLTLGPHNHFWFLLKKMEPISNQHQHKRLPKIKLEHTWQEIFEPKTLKSIERNILPAYLPGCRWFGGKARKIRSLKIDQVIPLEKADGDIALTILKIDYRSGQMEENYFLPLSYLDAHKANHMIRDFPGCIIARVEIGEKEGYLLDGVYDPALHQVFLNMILKKKKLRGKNTLLSTCASRQLKSLLPKGSTQLNSRVLKAEQSNTSILYGDVFYLKMFRRLEQGINPDTEIMCFLTEKKKFLNVPPFAGDIEFTQGKSKPMVLCLLQGNVPNQGDAWQFTLDHLNNYFERALGQRQSAANREQKAKEENVPFHEVNAREFLDGFYLDMIKLLGQRTAQMHMQLSGDSKNSDFAPEAFSQLYQRAVLQSMGSQSRSVFRLFKSVADKLPKEFQPEVKDVLDSERNVNKLLKTITNQKFAAKKIRIHGDYHLGQVLFTGKDFYIIDFEGEPLKSLSERRLKRSPLRDVAGMLRSFHYAAFAALFLRKTIAAEDIAFLQTWAEDWYTTVSETFLQSYYETIGEVGLLPKNTKHRDQLMKIFLMDKAIYELGYELNNRPDWVIIPLRGIRSLLKSDIKPKSAA